MTLPAHLDSESLRRTMVVYHAALVQHRQRLNILNVYPVPDADTGNNMSMTMQSVVAALDAAGPTDVTTAISRGSLLGARGVSGVILSRLLGTMAARLGEAAPPDGPDLAAALRAGAEAAHEAVLQPVEGTMLTVARAAADGAAAAGRAPLTQVLEAAREAAADALAHTPELLPALRTAGVVDAGGAGYLLFLDAMRNVVAGVPVPTAEAFETHEMLDTEPVSGRFEVVVRLAADAGRLSAFRTAWNAAGVDAGVIVDGAGDLWVAHTHTDDVDATIAAAEAAGRVLEVQVTDLVAQIADHGERTELRTGLLVVAEGAGLRELFRRLGATAFVTGGAGRKPSPSELLDAVQRITAHQVIVIPNDPRIIPAAEQAADLTGATVIVVPTRTVPEGLAAADAFDPTRDANDNVQAMTRAARSIRSGSVTQAVRDATTEAGPVHRGDWLGITPDRLVAVADGPLAAAQRTLEVLVDVESAIITLIAGAESTDIATLERWAAEQWPGLEVYAVDGGQPLYPLIIGVSGARRGK